MSFIARQPNGLLCRWSSISDSITHYNMTDDEYIEMCAERARQEAEEVLERRVYDFGHVLDMRSEAMDENEFDKIIRHITEK